MTAPAETPETPAADPVAQVQERMEAITTAIQQQGDQNGQLAANLAQLQGQLTQLTQHMQQTNRPTEPEAVEPSEEFKKLYANIPGYVRQQAREEATELLKSTLAPHLRLQAEQTRESILNSQQAKIDSQFGVGTWAADFQADIEATIGQLPLEMQASRQHMEAAVAAILGRKYLDPEGRKVLATKETAATKAREEATPLLDRGRGRPPKGEALDQSQVDFLASLRRSGIDYSEDQYKKAITGGRSLKEWRASHPPAKK